MIDQLVELTQTLDNCDSAASVVLTFVSLVLTLVSAVVAYSLRYFRFQQRSVEHLIASDRYHDLLRKVERYYHKLETGVNGA